MKKREIKKGLFLVVGIAVMTLVFSAIWAGADEQSGTTIDTTTITTANIADVSQDVPNNGYSCLTSKVNNESHLSFEQAIFAGLALGKGNNDKIFNVIKENKKSNEACWPASGCSLKATAQVALYYNRIGENTDNIVQWIESKNATATGLTWYLEMDILDHNAAQCTVEYDDISKDIQIGDDMKLDSGAATACFAPSASGYWLQLADRCVDKSFDISCTKDFLTTLLYEKSAEGTIYISPDTHNAAQGARTTEKVEAKCLKTGNECDYEGTLWATLALRKIGIDTTDYVPYLQALEDENLKYFPSTFIYFIQPAQEQYSNVIEQQSSGGFWDITGSPYKKYYDTSLAILALDRSSSERNEIAQAQSYLASAQLKDGCWNSRDAIIDTGFVLYSAWARAITPSSENGVAAFCSEVPGASCETDESACLAAGGRELTIYTCLKAREFCCSVRVPSQTCADQHGTLCASGEECLAETLDSSDSGICCSTSCAPQQEPNTCPATSTCKTACGSDEEENTAVSCGDGRLCCAPAEPSSGSYTWLIILIVLIVIVVIAILFRHKIQMMWFSWRKGKVKSTPVTRPGNSGTAPVQGFGPRPPFGPGMTRPMTGAPARPLPSSRASRDNELEETMRKLREMSK